MSQFENSEIMVKYAELMLKEAAPPRRLPGRTPDIIDADFEVVPPKGQGSGGADRASAGGESFWNSPAGMAGTMLGADIASRAAMAAGAKLFGGGALTGLAGAALPAAAVIAAVAVVGGIGYGIYLYIERTDDNVADLIDRIKSLDYEDTDVERTVNSWIVKLNSLRQAFAVPMTTGDPKERLETLGNKIVAFEEGLNDIKAIESNYHKYVKKHLKDWFGSWGDLGDFERTLAKTSANYEKRLKAMGAEFKKLNTQVNNPTEILKDVQGLQKKITSLWAAPEFNKKEQEALDWATQGGVGSAVDVRKNTAILLRLKSDLKNKILPQAKKKYQQATGHKASSTPPLSKRAVSLPKQPTAVTPRKRRKAPAKFDTVRTMQEQINDLSTALGVNIGGRISEDGVYGPRTASAVLALISAFGQADPKEYPARANLASNLKSRGISTSVIGDDNLMRSTPRYLNTLTNTMAEVWKYHVGSGGKPMSQRAWSCQVCAAQNDPNSQACQRCGEPKPGTANGTGAPQGSGVHTGPVACDFGTPNPSDKMMLACFKTLQDRIGGSRVYLYDYARHNLGMSDQGIINMLNRLFKGYPPRNWSMSQILDAMASRYSLAG